MGGRDKGKGGIERREGWGGGWNGARDGDATPSPPSQGRF